MGGMFQGKYWFKAWYLFAPVWISDPYGECYVRGRGGFIGEILIDLADFFTHSINFALSFLNPDYEPHFQFRITDKDFKE